MKKPSGIHKVDENEKKMRGKIRGDHHLLELQLLLLLVLLALLGHTVHLLRSELEVEYLVYGVKESQNNRKTSEMKGYSPYGTVLL